MTDRELLQLAAKAAGIDIRWYDNNALRVLDKCNGFAGKWNPLTDDGDALRLAVKLRLHIDHHRSGVSVWVMTWVSDKANADRYEEDTGDDARDTRLAIVRAAAEIAKAMP